MNHILIIYLGSRGGGVLDTYEICKSLCEVGKNCYSLLISENNPFKDGYLSLPLKNLFILKTHTITLKSFFFHTFFFVRILKIIKYIREINPAAVFFTMEHPWMLFILFYLKIFMSKTKVVYIKHNPTSFESLSSKTLNILLEKIDRILTKKSDYIFTLSEYVKNDVVEKFRISTDKIYNFKLGAHSLFCDNWYHLGFYRDGILRLLFFGRILKYKGLNILVDAYELMKKKYNLPVQLTIAGEGLIDKILSEKIKELGIKLLNYWISDEELCKLLSETDIIVIPYIQASQSGPTSIAVSLGIPVIASKVGGLSEQVHDGINGILIEPNNPEEIVKAVKAFLDKPSLLNKFASGAKLLRENQYSWKRIALSMDKVFCEMLQR